jgi:serine/threonine protein kinase
LIKSDISREDLHKRGVIGEGNFGEVYWGEYNGELVAVKAIFRSDEKAREELLNEAVILQALEHPCIIKFIGVYDAPLCLVLELAKYSLSSLIHSPKAAVDAISPPPPKFLLKDQSDEPYRFCLWFLLSLLKDTCSAIDFMHSLSIIHR